MTERLRSIARAVYGWLPKADIAVLWGWPDHEDSVVALEAALQRTRVKRVVVLVTDRRTGAPMDPGPKTVVVRKGSVRALLWFLVARYVFFTHRCYMRQFPRRVTSVNVWHGMAIKRIGRLVPDDPPIESTHLLATSPYWAEIMGRCMDATDGVLDIGLPRNDRLRTDPARAREALGLEEGERLVVWLPTFRRSVRGRLTVDGVPTGDAFELPGVDPLALDTFLGERGARAIVKPHPMSAWQGEQQHDHLLITDAAGLQARGLTLYEVLGASSILISDVSSVTIDYLLLDRPIIHALADLDQYRDTRGFTMADVGEVLAGPVATSVDELLAALDVALRTGDVEPEVRRRSRARSHRHLDAGATERLLVHVGLLDGPVQTRE